MTDIYLVEKETYITPEGDALGYWARNVEAVFATYALSQQYISLQSDRSSSDIEYIVTPMHVQNHV